MRKVAIVSFETSNFEKKSTNPILEVAAETCVNLIKKSCLSRNSIEALFFSSCTEEQYTASIVSQMIGLKPKFAHRIDNLCNSGTDSIISAYSYIASGLCDCALVVGVEGAKSPGKQLLWDISRGSFNFPVNWASIYAKCHMRKYGTTQEQMAAVTVKNRFNAQRNPKAVFNEAVTIDD